MYSFSEFLVEYERKDFLDIAHTPLEKARTYFTSAMSDAGVSMEKDFPNFDSGYTLARTKIAMGRYPRKKMPVVKSEDFDQFVSYMRDSHGVSVKKSRERAVNLIPIQNQLYLDNPARNITTHGLKNAIDFLKNKSHAIISRDNYVMDGNHRLLLAILYDRDMMLQVNRVDMNAEELYHEMNYFTDKIIKRARNK